ncbi:MAG: hypothetical protein KGK05_03825 [Xanthomonadaceae bacterium]|nr:hypothetical protein [Xanthomonadaceae bacterium]
MEPNDEASTLDAMIAWDRLQAWSGWEHAEVIELMDAAHILTVTKPRTNAHNRILPANVEAMLQTLKQTILLGHLPVFAVWVWDENGDRDPIEVRDVTPHTTLHSCTTVKVSDLVAWCEARNIAHPWHANNAGKDEMLEHFPDELRAAIEAFRAVHGDPAATAKRSPKAALTAWLDSNKPKLSANARERIATVANWQPTGGAPKTPGE